MRVVSILALAAALFASGGCFVLESAKAPAACGDAVDEHLIAYNYGWNLFGCIPIVCGNANEDSWCPFAFFRNDVTHERVAERMRRYAERKGVRLEEVTCLDDRDVFFDLYYAPVPWIIQYKEVNFSAMTVKGGAE